MGFFLNGSLRVNPSQVGETRFPHNAVGVDVSCRVTRVAALCWKTQSDTPAVWWRGDQHPLSLSGGFSSTLTVICWKAMAHNFEKDVRNFCMNLQMMGKELFFWIFEQTFYWKMSDFLNLSPVFITPPPLVILFAGKFGRLWLQGADEHNIVLPIHILWRSF